MVDKMTDEERTSIRAIADVWRLRESGAISVDEAIRIGMPVGRSMCCKPDGSCGCVMTAGGPCQ